MQTALRAAEYLALLGALLRLGNRRIAQDRIDAYVHNTGDDL